MKCFRLGYLPHCSQAKDFEVLFAIKGVTSVSYESLVQYMTHVVLAKQSSRESCVNDVIMWRPLQTLACFFTAMTDNWSSSSEEENGILLGDLAVLQQINDEEEKEKLKKRKSWWVRLSISRRQQFGAFHALVKHIKVEDPRTFANFVWMDAQQFQYLFAVNRPQTHSHARRNTTCWASWRKSSICSDEYIT